MDDKPQDKLEEIFQQVELAREGVWFLTEGEYPPGPLFQLASVLDLVRDRLREEIVRIRANDANGR